MVALLFGSDERPGQLVCGGQSPYLSMPSANPGAPSFWRTLPSGGLGGHGGPRRRQGPRGPVRPTRASKGCPRTRARGTCASWGPDGKVCGNSPPPWIFQT